jgi:hypothetical protein
MRILIALLLSCPLWAAPTIWTVCASGCGHTSLQDAIAHTVAADTGPQIIELKAGENFDTATGFTLPARTGKYTGWIIIRSSRVSELPANTRVSPSDTAKMAALRVTAGGYTSVLYTTGHPSSYWRLEGLEFTLSTTGLANTGWLIGIGQGLDTGETEPSKVSHHFVIDRCYIHGIAFDNGPRDGIRVNGDNIEVLNSYLSEIKRDSDESHAILGYSLNGPLLVRNTFHGGAAIGSLIGGAANAGRGIHPQHLRFVGNHYQKTPTHRALRYAADPQGTTLPTAGMVREQTYWQTDTSVFRVYTAGGGWQTMATGITGDVCVDGDFWHNTTAGTYFLCAGGVWTGTGSNRTITGGTVSPFTHFWSKNAFEFKAVDGALVEGNLIENCFSPTDQYQACGAFLLNFFLPTDGVDYSISMREVTIRNNLVRGVGSLIQQAGGWLTQTAFSHRFPRDIRVENNLWEDSGSLKIAVAINKFNFYSEGSGIITQYGQTSFLNFDRQWIRHNTVISPFTNAGFATNDHIYTETAGYFGVNVNDNLIETAGLYQVARGTLSSGCGGFGWTSSAFNKNLIVNFTDGGGYAQAALYDSGADCRSWGWPLKRNGTGVTSAAASATISGGSLKITFAGSDHGLLQGTRVKLAGWSPSGLNTTYTVPRYCCGGASITSPRGQNAMWLATAETGAVTPGTIEASVDYTNWAAKNFRLASTSAYKGWASDGSDPGANQDVVEWATAGSASGADNPYLDFRVRSVAPTADGAVLRFTAYSTAACTWRASSTRAFADDLGSWGSQTRTGRDGVVTVTGLSSDTGYWYRVTCDSKTRDGEFVTTH